MKIYHGDWGIDPDGWNWDYDDGILTLTQDEAEGALQISAFRKKDGPITHDELVESADERLPQGTPALEVACGEFSGVCGEFVEDDVYWRMWWVARENLLLYVTFNCDPACREAQTAAVKDTLATLECKKSSHTDDDGNPYLEFNSEEGFVDLTFRIMDLRQTDTHHQFHLAASYKNQLVGFDVELTTGIQAGFDANVELLKDRVYRQGVRFRRSGYDSDRLITALGELYALGCSGKMVSEESFTVIALHQGELDFTQQTVKLKLFGRDGAGNQEDDYYESFFNVDLRNGFVYWNEKDEGYRKPLLRALSASTEY